MGWPQLRTGGCIAAVGESADIARLLLASAEGLERQGLSVTATLQRRAARRLVEVGDRDPDGCATCGGELVQPARQGRRRIYCFECSPRKETEKARVAA